MSWSKIWPTEPGYYWFWDPKCPEIVEPGRVIAFGPGHASRAHIRCGEMIYEREFPEVMWHPMPLPPAAPQPDTSLEESEQKGSET